MTEMAMQRHPSQLTPTQKVIARRMTEAQAVPIFTATRDVDVTRLVRQRAQVKAAGDRPASLNDVLVACVARALREHPRVNGSYDPAGFVLNDEVNVGVAVAAGDRLLVPVVKAADRLPLEEIGRETARLAEAVRTGAVAAADLSGATFTISNLGMLGVDSFTAMINVPQAAILAVGRVRRVATFEDGTVGVAHVMSLTITADHRIVYGADAARFLASVDDELQATTLAPRS
ncbi:hypothetical protein ASC64_03055 [Nocardioides sp. Root122]|uniref:2-oxo acid dehydrogenase subunit E2 n=1 Tax=Nocardioides TaxID=1839 RepID=UPI0007025E0C|nr:MULTISPECIES: 2-oxo acid dehydrogenase subunit E2 [Nocardioides]KQV77810.1 hypothetical protein ASC64_03055 [Nocardioides sp. Root122]MCK9822290.1 2-oxo acid dehydrogenase subunit E2 [Nocardioides cavernae]